MNISPNDPLTPESQRVWEKITREHIEAEIITYIGINNLEELVVVLNLNSQEPPFVDASSTGAPSSSPSEVPTNPDQAVITNIKKSGTRGDFLWDIRRTQDANLNIGFSVDIFIRSALKEHIINHYIGDAFDTQEDRQSYLTDLVLSDASFERAQRLNVILPDPPPAPTPAPSNDIGTTSGMIVGLFVVAFFGSFVGYFFVHRKRLRNNSLLKNALPLEIEETEDGEHACAEIDVRVEGDISTLGDPFPFFVHDTEQPSIADTMSLGYDFKRAYQGADGPSLADFSEGDDPNLVLAKDDDTMDAHYFAGNYFEVEAPPGLLGMVLVSSADGIPTVLAIKPCSPLASDVQVGDQLLRVDGKDVTASLSIDVARLIATKRKNDLRRFVFTRPPAEDEQPVGSHCSETIQLPSS